MTLKTKTKTMAVAALLLLGGTAALSGCASQSDTVSENLSVAAENFEIERRITFYNGITGNDFLIMEGRCSIEDGGGQLEVTCKVADNEYIKNFLGLSDNITYFTEQLETADASVYHYRVIFKPESILPEVEVSTGQQ